MRFRPARFSARRLGALVAAACLGGLAAAPTAHAAPSRQAAAPGADAAAAALAKEGSASIRPASEMAQAAPLAVGGGAPANLYYRYIDSDEPPNPPAVVPPTPNFIDIRATGTQVILGDDTCTNIALDGEVLPADDEFPFVFTYHDVQYQTVDICSNGVLSFGGPYTVFNNVCPPLASSPGGIVMPYWDDLHPGIYGQVFYDVRGSFPNRTFIVQWEQVATLANPADTVIFQAQLLERTGNIRFEYFNVESGEPDGIALSPTGDLLVAEAAGDKVLRFSGGAFVENQVRSRSGSLSTPGGLSIGNGINGDAVGDPSGDGADDLYVTSFDNDRVLLFEGGTTGPALNHGAFLGQIITPGAGGLDGPRDVVFGPDNNLYVSSFHTDQVLRYNGSSGAFLNVFVAAGSGGLDGPDDLLFAPDGNLYVSSFNNDRVLKYNGATGALIGTFVAAGSGGLDGPRGLAWGPADGNLYVASELNDRVLRYSGVNGDFFNVAVDPGFGGLDAPRSMVFDASGDLRVAGFNSDVVHVFDVDQRNFLSAGSGLDFPEGIVFNGGFAYVSSRDTDQVLRYSATTGAFVGVFVTAGSGGLDGPQDLVFGPNGNLFVSSIFSDEVIEYNGTTGAFIDEFVEDDPGTLLVDEDGGLDGPHGLRFQGGDLYVASIDTHEVKRYNGTTGAFISNFVSAGSGGLSFPVGIVFAGSDLYVASSGTDQVKRYNSAGAFVSNFVAAGSGGLDRPIGITFGGVDNNLYVASADNDRVLAYDGASGASIGTFAPAGSGGLDEPRMLAFGPDGRLYVASRFTDQVLTTLSFQVSAIPVGGQRDAGKSATVGLDGTAAFGLQYGCNPGGGVGAPIVHDDLAILFIAPPPPGADLEVVYKKTDLAPDECYNEGDTVTFEIKVRNNGREDATGVTVDDQLPDGLTYVSSAASQGSYNPGTGVWTVGNLARQAMATLTIVVTVDPDTASILGRFEEEFVVSDNPPLGRLIKPHDIAVGPDGNYYVSNSGRDEVLRYSPAGAFIDVFVPGGTGGLFRPAGLEWRTGQLYVVSSGTNQVLRYDATGAFTGVFIGNPVNPIFPNGVFVPKDIVFDAAGRAYVSSSINHRVLRFPATGGTIGVVVAAALGDVASPFPGSTLNLPHGMLFGPDRNADTFADLYVASEGGSEILIFSGNPSLPAFLGALVNNASGFLSGPTFMTIGPNNSLWVSSRGGGSVLRFDLTSGDYRGEVVPSTRGGVAGPHGLLLEASRLLVVSQDTHQVLAYGTLPTGNYDSQFIAEDGIERPRAVTLASNQQLIAAYRKPGDANNLIIQAWSQTNNTQLGTIFDDEVPQLVDIACLFATIAEVYDVAVSEDLSRIYVALELTCGRVAVVMFQGPSDPMTSGDFLGVIAGDDTGLFNPLDRMKGLTIGPDGNLYVSRQSSPPRIERFVGGTGAALGVFASAGGMASPTGLTFGPDRNADGIDDLYVSNEGNNSVVAFSGADGSSLGVVVASGLGGLSGAQDVAIGPDGNIYVTSFNTDQVLRYTPAGAFIGSFATAFSDGPSGIVFLDDGDAVVANRNNDRINRYDGGVPFLGVFAQVTADGLNCASFLTFGPDQTGDGVPELFVSAYHQDVVKRFNGATGAYINDFATTGLDGPKDLLFGPDGHLYVASSNNDKVVRFNGATGAFIDNFVGGIWPTNGLNQPIGLAFSTDNILYVASSEGGQILRYVGPTYGFLSGAPFFEPFVTYGGTPSLVAPTDITFGPDSNGDGNFELYASVANGVYRYDGELGTFLDVVTIGGDLAGAEGITFGADGMLYVASSGNDKVLVYNPNTNTFVRQFNIVNDDLYTIDMPIGIAFGPDGDLYVATCGDHNVVRFSGPIANYATVDGDQDDARPANNTGSAAVCVVGADLMIEKTVDKRTPFDGDTVTFTITLKNLGPEPATAVTALDVLDPGITIHSAVASQGTYNIGSGTWTVNPPTLGVYDPDTDAPKATLTLVGTVDANASASYDFIDNTITAIDAIQGDPDDTNNTATATVFLTWADLQVTKTAAPTLIDEGANSTFTVSVTNPLVSTADAENVVLTDLVPAGLAYVSDDSGGAYNPLTGAWNVGTLVQGATETIHIVVVALPGSGGQTFTNEAFVSQSSVPDPFDVNNPPNNNRATATVTVRGADLRIVKTVVTPPPHLEGALIDFNLFVENLGSRDAANVRAIDRLPACLAYVAHAGGNYDPVSGLWTIGPLANGANASLTITARLLPGCGGKEVRNLASVDSDTGDQDRSNNQSVVSIMAPSVDLDILITSRPGPLYPALDAPGDDGASPDALTPRPLPNPGPALAGHSLFYDITVLNRGIGTATNVVFTATLETDVHYVTDNLVPHCVEAPVGQLTCQLGSIPGGGQKQFTIQTEVGPNAFLDRALAPEPLVLELFTGVTSDQPDLDPRDNTEVHLSLLQDLADVRVMKVSKPDTTVRAGEVFTYTILVENLGPSAARDLIITDTILSSNVFTLVGILGDPGRPDSCLSVPAPAPQSGQLLRCTLDAALEPVGSGLGSGRWTVQVTVRATQTQDVNNEVRVASRDGETAKVGTPDPRLANNVAVDHISVADTSDLFLTKSEVGRVHSPTVCATVADTANGVTAGAQLTWTLVVTNRATAFGEPGGSVATNVRVADAVPAGLEIVSIAGAGPAGAAGCHAGTPGVPADPARCVFDRLAAGQSGTVTIVARVDAGYVGASGTNTIVNSAFASSDNLDPFTADNFAQQTTAVGEVADLSITKLAQPSPVIAGRPLSYELVVRSDGPSVARSVVVRDALPAALQFVGARIENQRGREACTYSEGAHEVICSLFEVAPGEPPAGGRRVFIDTVVRASAAAGVVANTATVRSDVTPDCDPADNSATVIVPVQTQADVAVQKSADPVRIAAGRQIRYTVTVFNNGPSDAQNVVVSDTLPPEVRYEIDTLQPMCIVTNAPAIPQTLSCAIGTLPSGQTRSFDIWVRVEPNIPAGTTITNNVAVTSQTSLGDPVTANNAAFAKNHVRSVVDLQVTKFGTNIGRVAAGKVLTYTVIVDNHGPSFAEGVALKDVLQAGEQFDLIDITSDRPAICRSLANGATETNNLPGTPWPPALPPVPPVGVLEPSGIPFIGQRLEVDCTLNQVLTPAFGIPQLGVLLADGPPNTGRWILTMRVRFRQAQDMNNIADVVSTSEEIDPANNHAEVEHEITDVANLSVTKTALGEVQVNGQAGRIVNTQAALPALPEAPFYSGSSSQVTAGRRIRYTIRVQNSGPSDAENVLVTDRLPAGVTVLPGTVRAVVDNMAPLPAGACQTGTPGEPSDRFTCGLGTLLGVDSAQRRGATITFDVLVDPNVAPGTVLENDVDVRSDVFDPTIHNNHAHVQTTVLAAADLSTSKTAVGQNVTGYDVAGQRFVIADQPNAATAGLELRYELAVQNAGPSTSRNVTLRDVLPAGVTFLRADGGARCRADAVNGGTLYCSVGDMAPGERRTFSIYVAVDQAVAQGTVLRNCVDALFAAASPPAPPPPLPPAPPELSLTLDPLATNNQACNNTTVNAVADIGGPGDGGPFGDANGFLQKVDVPAEPRLDRLTEPDLAIAGREHRYRITFGNAGPSTAVSVVLTDTLDFKQPGLAGERFVRCEPHDPDDRVLCSYNAATNVVTLTQLKVHNETIFNAGVGTLAPGIGYGFDLITIVDPGYVLDAANAQAAGPLNSEAGLIARNTAFLTTATTDFRRQNNRDTERTRIIAEADLAITKTDIFGDFLTCDPVTPGGMVTYEIVASNLGPSDAAEVFVVDQLPPEAVAVDPDVVDVTVSAGEVVEVRDDGRITLRIGNGVNNAGVAELGRLNAGESVTVTIMAMVRQSAACGSLFANTAFVETRRNDTRWPLAQTGPAQGPGGQPPTTARTPTLDPLTANNRAVESTAVACPSVVVDKTVSFDGVCPGADLPVINETAQPVTFCFEIKNTGTTYLDDIRITDTLRSRSTMPTIIFTDTIRFGVDPKVPVAPGEIVRRQVTVPHLTRECGNAIDTVEVSANPVNSGRTDLSCLPIVTDTDSVRIEVPCAGVDFRLQLPIVGGEGCETWIQVQNVGDAETIPVLVVWGDAGFCPPQAAGPLKVECSGLLRPGSAWSFATSQIPGGAHSAVVYSLSAATVEEQPGQPIAFGRLVCDKIYTTVTGSDLNWLIFDTAYRKRGSYEGYDFAKFAGEPLAVVVNRACPDPVDPNRVNHAAYEGVSSDLEGAYDPESGGFTTYAPFVVSGNGGLDSVLHIQNSGELCTSLEIWFKAQDNCLRPILGDVIQLSRGETVDFEASTVVGTGWIGSAWIRASQPLGVVVDTRGPNHFTSYVGVPADIEALDFSLGDQVNYAPLIYNEYQGWDTAIQVQNLSSTMAAKVKVYFLDFGGGIKQTLVDWICPRGSNSFFLPVIAGLPGAWTGSARVESQEWWTPGGPVADPPRLQSIVILERWSDPARSERREAVAYNASTETIYDWQLGNGKGGVASGSAVFALPMVAKRNRGVSTEIAIANLVPKPGFTNFAVFLYDQNGLIDYVCETLGEKQVEYINVDSWGWVRPSFLGSMVVSATFWEHDVFDAQGRFVRNLVGLGAVGVERIGAVLGEPDVPGDESKAYGSFPLFDFFLLENKPACDP